MEIKTYRYAVRVLIGLAHYVQPNPKFRPYKYEIEKLIGDFESKINSVPKDEKGRVVKCITYLKGSKNYLSLGFSNFIPTRHT